MAKSKSNARRLLASLFVGALFGAAGFLVGAMLVPKSASAEPSPHHPLVLLLVSLVSVIVGLILAIIVHELGHALAGAMVGRQFRSFGVGPLMITRREGRWGLRWYRIGMGIAGMVLSVETRSGLHPRKRRLYDAFFTAGGCIANLLFAVALLLLALLPLSSFWDGQLYILSVLNLGLAVGNLLPFSLASGFQTDGRKLWSLLFGGGGGREWVVSNLTHATLADIRPRDWPADDVAKLDGPADGSYGHVLASYLLYCRRLDEGAIEQAGRHLDDALAHTPDVVPMMIGPMSAEAAWFVATHRGDIDAARAHLAKASGPIVERHSLKLAEAAIARASGDLPLARAHAQEALAAWERPIFHGSIETRERIVAALADVPPLATAIPKA